MAPAEIRTSSTVNAASVGPLTRRWIRTPDSRPPDAAMIAPGWSPGSAPAGTVTEKGISARVRGGTVSGSEARVIQVPAPVDCGRRAPRGRPTVGVVRVGRAQPDGERLRARVRHGQLVLEHGAGHALQIDVRLPPPASAPPSSAGPSRPPRAAAERAARTAARRRRAAEADAPHGSARGPLTAPGQPEHPGGPGQQHRAAECAERDRRVERAGPGQFAVRRTARSGSRRRRL